MADAITIKALQDASLDAKSLEEVVNGNESKQVTTRKGATYPSIKKAIKTLFENGGLPATPFATKALMTASSLANDKYAMVTDDTVNNGLYVKTAGAWVASTLYDNYIKRDDVVIGYYDGNLIGDKSLKYLGLGVNTQGNIQERTYHDSVVIPVTPNSDLYIHRGVENTNTWSIAGGFLPELPQDIVDEKVIPSAGTSTQIDPVTGISYKKYVVPQGAKYFMVNTRQSEELFEWVASINAPLFENKKGRVYVHYIDGKTVNRDINYLNERLKDYEIKTPSNKNKYDGNYITRKKIGRSGVVAGNDNDIITSFIPVEYGKHYVVSGIRPDLRGSFVAWSAAYSEDNFESYLGYVNTLETSEDSLVHYIYIDNPDVKYIQYQLTAQTPQPALDRGYLTTEDLVKNEVWFQVEEGTTRTFYVPPQGIASVNKQIDSLEMLVNDKLYLKKPKYISQFTPMNYSRDTTLAEVAPHSNAFTPLGMATSIEPVLNSSYSNSFYAKEALAGVGKKSLYINMSSLIDGSYKKAELVGIPFTIPSGQFDNPNTLNAYTLTDENGLNLAGYCHPEIAYSDTPIGGYKYWLVSSILPPYGTTGATWEDEDLFVSNDAVNWERVRSMYEDDKDYTTSTLRLPPQKLVTETARKHAFLPCPQEGDTLEISIPPTEEREVFDKRIVTLTNRSPFKHDPAICIADGFVYVYHSFHIPLEEGGRGTDRFLVCVRTSNGVDWDVVRQDGSTMRLTEETSKQLFTKDSQGRYNYIYYMYREGFSNPTVVKYGDSDFELFYGANYSRRFAGTTPYNFDFSNVLPMHNVGGGNHPTIFYYPKNDAVYKLTNDSIWESFDRGVSFEKLDYYPAWFGGISGYGYKKAVCIGEGDSLVLADVQRYLLNSEIYVDHRGDPKSLRDHQITLYKFKSVDAFLDRAKTTKQDSYVDVHISKVNYVRQTQEVFIRHAVDADINGNSRRSYLTDMEFYPDDILHVYITINGRFGGTSSVASIDILPSVNP